MQIFLFISSISDLIINAFYSVYNFFISPMTVTFTGPILKPFLNLLSNFLDVSMPFYEFLFINLGLILGLCVLKFFITLFL